MIQIVAMIYIFKFVLVTIKLRVVQFGLDIVILVINSRPILLSVV